MLHYPQTIMEAVKAGDVDAMEKFINDGADMETVDENGDTPLIVSAVRGLAEIVQKLLESGADVNATDPQGYTALSLAAFFGQTDVVEILISGGAAVDAPDVDGFTALHTASEEGHLKVVQALLRAGADVNAQTTVGGATPIFLVSAANPTTSTHFDVLRTLIESGGDISINAVGEVTPLHGAAKIRGTESIMQVLIDEVRPHSTFAVLVGSIHPQVHGCFPEFFYSWHHRLYPHFLGAIVSGALDSASP